uniref:Uncharacterized protein n=1 Tax=Zooxanthella nutricula TaxID=1333877 RepID=A0A7S2JHJ3_9DINO
MASSSLAAGCGHYLPRRIDNELAESCALLLAVLLVVPLAILALASVSLAFSVLFDRRPSHAKDIERENVEKADQHDGTSALVCSVLPTNGMSRTPSLSKLDLPASLRAYVVPRRIKLPATPSGVIAAPIPKEEMHNVCLPLPLDTMFSVPSLSNFESKSQLPQAAIITPGRGLLVYRDPANNGNATWQEAVRQFFESQPSVSREIVRVVQETERNYGADTISIVEVVGGADA